MAKPWVEQYGPKKLSDVQGQEEAISKLKTAVLKKKPALIYGSVGCGKTFRVDKSTALRKLLQKGIEEDRKEGAVELYRKGELSLEGAAKFAGLYIGEFLELLREKGIELNVTTEDYMEGLKNLKRIAK